MCVLHQNCCAVWDVSCTDLWRCLRWRSGVVERNWVESEGTQGKEPGEHGVFLVVDVVVEIDWHVVQDAVDYVRHVWAWASCGAPVLIQLSR